MKIEDVYDYIAIGLESRRSEFTQKEISRELEGSISSVHYALKPLERIGSIIKRARGFRVIDPNFWCTRHLSIRCG